GVTADTVRESRLEVGENFPAAQRGAIAHDVEHDDVGGILRPVGGAGVHDVAPLEVRREADAVRAPHRALGRDRRLAARIQTIDAGGQLELGFVPFIRPENPVARIGEPDRAVGMDGRIVGRVELLAIELVDQDGPGAVVLAAADPAGVVLERDQPALVVARMPVRIPGLGLVHADGAVVLVPTERPVVRDVAPDQAAPVTHPNRSLAPERTVVAHAVPASLPRRVPLDSGAAAVTDGTAGGTLPAHTVRETGCEPRSGTRSPPTSPIDLRGTTNTRTPPSAIRMVNEGAEEPPRDPMPGSHCFARRPARLCARGPGLSRTNLRHAGAT